MNYPYLTDFNFLKRLDMETRKVQYVRITVLNFKTEAAIASIEGIATGGSANLNGTSNVRRTASCSLLVIPGGIDRQGSYDTIKYAKITEVENLISINKKIRMEIGFENTLSWDNNCYPEYNTIWFPLGTFIIKSASIARSNSGMNISLTLNDKTALLNGDVGGVIPAATVFSESELYSADASERTVEQILIKDIIKHLVIDFGGEDPSNVIIEDVPDNIRKVMKWTGDSDLYYYEQNKLLVTEKQEKNGQIVEPDKTFTFGQDCGYMAEPFHYPGTLECNAGETVAAMLDKIKNALGNYEWFYDVNGRFHFQEKKNYINTSHATTIENLTESGYLSTMNLSKTVYTFDAENRKLLTNISSSPQYQNVKNDFIVWGTTKTASGVDKPIRYHLAFDVKPEVDPNKLRLAITYTDYRGLMQAIILTEDNYRVGPRSSHPEINDEEAKSFYFLIPAGGSILPWYHIIECWDNEREQFRIFIDFEDGWEVCYLKTADWRTELYYLGLEASNKTFAKNYYAAELNSEWPKIYGIKGNLGERGYTSQGRGQYGHIYEGAYLEGISPNQYEYFLDFIEGGEGGNANLSQFTVDNIGRRTKIGKDKSANCVFAAEVPNLLIIFADGDTVADYESAISGYDVIQVSEDVFNKMVIGGNNTSAYDKIKELLVQHTRYNEAITLTTIPIYYLEPNSRIHIEDTELGINGDYMINTISLPLTIGTSNLSCSKCIENTI